jgi:amidophosphoribosyltransferase
MAAALVAVRRLVASNPLGNLIQVHFTECVSNQGASIRLGHALGFERVGTTSRKIVKMVRAAGAKEVHMRISCPPTISPCFYGVDTPKRSELIAATHDVDEIRRYIGADSLGYLSMEGLLSAVGNERGSYCTSCYSGQYPVAFPRNEAAYLQLALKLTK